MSNLDNYYTDLMNELDHSSSAGNYKSITFLEKVVPYMEEQGVFSECELLHFDKPRYGRIDGIAFNATIDINEPEETIIIINHFNENLEIDTLTSSKIDQLRSSAVRFFNYAHKSDFLSQLEESSDEYQATYQIYKNTQFTEKLKVIIVTNCILSKRIANIKQEDTNTDVSLTIDVWDINRLFQLEMSQQRSEAITIDLNEWGGTIPALPATTTENLQSYLCIIDGKTIADLYEEYGGRLLEANVRSFLSFRGKVNKGIRKTINTEPDLFFSYNNGLTTTASDVEFDYSTNKISKLTNLQIVNGGQTTATLLLSSKKDRANLKDVKVQVKLNVVSPDMPDMADELVSNISKYANSQNAIKDSDFFSNHPFHRRMEEFSRRIWAPVSDRNLKQTHWYYERARGSYFSEQAKFTPAEKKAYESENPKKQLITKTDLAKLNLIFSAKPHDSVKGAETAFRRFAEKVQAIWEKNTDLINEYYFKESVAKLIILQSCKEVVYNNEDFVGNTKATITAYTIHAILTELAPKKLTFDYLKIWNEQRVHSSIQKQLKDISIIINNKLNALSIEHEKAVLSMAKSNDCLERINKAIKEESLLTLSSEFINQLIDPEVSKSENRHAIGEQKQEESFRELSKLFNSPLDNWKLIIASAQERNILTPREESLLKVIPNLQEGRSTTNPTNKQLKDINLILDKLELEGLYLT